MQIPKSYWYYWYYWHTGNKSVAITSMTLSTAVTWLVLAISAGFSIWGIILAVLLDTLGFWIVVTYLALRSYLPSSYLPKFLMEEGDKLIMNQFVIPVCIALVVGRLITLLVAKFNPQWSKKGVMALLALVIMGSGAVVLKMQYDQKKALEEAAAHPGRIEVLKAAAVRITNDAVESTSQAADGAKRKLSDTCKSLAVSLEKNPDEYCK